MYEYYIREQLWKIHEINLNERARRKEVIAASADKNRLSLLMKFFFRKTS